MGAGAAAAATAAAPNQNSQNEGHDMRSRHLALGILAILCTTMLVLAGTDHASAHNRIAMHAKLGHADPGIGAILATAPTTVTLQFVENVVPPPSSEIVVYGDKGEKVSGTTTFSTSSPQTLTVSMQGNGSETYLVTFHTTSADDGHTYTDGYQFTVSSSATASPGHQPDAAGDSISSVAPTTTASSSGISPLIAALIGIVALVIGAAGGFFVARGQRGSREGSIPLGLTWSTMP
jgi:methionine-rich copper-binding protein CopC